MNEVQRPEAEAWSQARADSIPSPGPESSIPNRGWRKYTGERRRAWGDDGRQVNWS